MSKNKSKKKDANACPLRKTSIGGQALMEGIMMRGPQMTAMAVRNTKGEIVIEKFPTVGKKRPKILRLPIIRGVLGFVDSMSLGYKCLMRSAEISGLEELEAEMAKEKAEKKAAKAAAKAAKKGQTVPADTIVAGAEEVDAQTEVSAENTEAVPDSQVKTASDSAEHPQDFPSNAAETKEKKKEESVLSGAMMVISVVLAVVLMVGLFFWMPTFLYGLLTKIPGFPNNRFLQSVFESVIRIMLLIGYMGLMCLLKDTRRTFQYHGAEHKTIFCYEHGKELTVENVRNERRFHPRCGTSFLILMLLVGIIIGFFIPAGLYRWLRVLIKILLMPLTMGIGYELIKICGKHDNWLTRIIAAPGLWFQHITVLEPDDQMIECAIASVKEVIPEDGSDQI